MRFLFLLFCYLCFTGKPSDFGKEKKEKIPKSKRNVGYFLPVFTAPVMSAKSISPCKNPTKM